jgi:hypothetical protein
MVIGEMCKNLQPVCWDDDDINDTLQQATESKKHKNKSVQRVNVNDLLIIF